MKTEIEYKRYRRFLVLVALYKKANGSISIAEPLQEIAAAIGIKNSNYDDAYQTLLDDKLIERPGIGGLYNLTHKGKKEVERSYLNPEEQSEFFGSLKSMGIN